MNELEAVIRLLREDALYRDVGSFHDRARDAYPNNARAVQTFADFELAIGEGYAFFHVHTMSNADANTAQAAVPRVEIAIGRAKEILTAVYRERGEDLLHAFEDAKRSMRPIYDHISSALREQHSEFQKVAIIDRLIPRDNYDMKLEFIRQMMARFPDHFRDFDRLRPERHIPDYDRMVRRIIRELDRFGREARRV
jgi:hypothetical protein